MLENTLFNCNFSFSFKEAISCLKTFFNVVGAFENLPVMVGVPGYARYKSKTKTFLQARWEEKFLSVVKTISSSCLRVTQPL